MSINKEDFDASDVAGQAASIRSLEDAITYRIGQLYRYGATDAADQLIVWLSEALDGAETLERLSDQLEA
jgi:hypothetical protein